MADARLFQPQGRESFPNRVVVMLLFKAPSGLAGATVNSKAKGKLGLLFLPYLSLHRAMQKIVI